MIQLRINLDYLIDRLNKEMKLILDNMNIRLFKSINSFVITNPDMLYKFKKQNLDHIINKLDVLNPLNTIKRGYAIVKKDNKVISDSNNIKKDDIIDIDVKNGTINAKVVEVINGE